MLRTGNKTAAALTLLGDAAKGWFAVWLAEQLAPGITPVALACVVVAAFLGHLYPIFLGFKGGKGVATALGVLVAIQPWLAVATAATWLIIAVFFRYSSLAALVAASSPRSTTCSARVWPGTRSRRWASRWPSSACCCSIATAPTSRA